nr:uncharacterized protein LOC127340437 [Lolium perenne]
MAGSVYRHDKDKEDGSHSSGKDKEEAGSSDRLRYDDRKYVTEEQVRSVRYQRPFSDHLLNKYERQYDRRRQDDRDDQSDLDSDDAADEEDEDDEGLAGGRDSSDEELAGSSADEGSDNEGSDGP